MYETEVLTIEVTKHGRRDWWPYRTVRFCQTRDEAARALWQARRDADATLVRRLDRSNAVVREFKR